MHIDFIRQLISTNKHKELQYEISRQPVLYFHNLKSKPFTVQYTRHLKQNVRLEAKWSGCEGQYKETSIIWCIFD